MTRLIAVRLLWYAGIAVVAIMALALNTQFSVAVLLSAIAIYIPLSVLCLPLMAWLCWSRGLRPTVQGLAPAWPAWLAGALGIALVASYHVLADLDLAECGFLLMLVAGDLWLVRREATQFFTLAPALPS
ncbi:hypothetical protein [Achromobacter sp. UMC46]|uniref:hypothetical protein n=1 Tax=Achromobacter sp. UMC46 TaxID=1862319 RepID=UPI00210625E9|nr:hypothetical protein [Achromobacter sp. UMC46]